MKLAGRYPVNLPSGRPPAAAPSRSWTRAGSGVVRRGEARVVDWRPAAYCQVRWPAPSRRSFEEQRLGLLQVGVFSRGSVLEVIVSAAAKLVGGVAVVGLPSVGR
jgi:hypothetical protein